MLLLPAQMVSLLADHAQNAAPREACGLLVGRPGSRMVTVTDFHLSENHSDGDTMSSFEIDPALHLRLQRDARESGQAVVGVWHSHPMGLPEPSATDQARSLEKGWIWLITGKEPGAGWQTRAFLAGEDPHALMPVRLTEAD